MTEIVNTRDSEGNTHSTLVGVQTGTATLENRATFPQERRSIYLAVQLHHSRAYTQRTLPPTVDICSSTTAAALKKQPTCPSVDGRW